MKKVVALVALALVAGFVACATRGARYIDSEHVPASYRDVRTSAGHTAHLGKVACDDCHGAKFQQPPAELCEKCHAKTTPLHPVDPVATKPGPRCVDCHAFGADTSIQPWNCLRCHSQDQNTFHAIGAHAGEQCGECHQPHESPGTRSRPCTECHDDRATSHAGLHGCRDCHDVHETKRPLLSGPAPSAAAGCETCHTKQQGKLHVDAHAYNAGHTACTTCHAPHDFKPKACGECHTKNQTAELPRHTCTTCHDEHGGGAPKACTSCHQQAVAHPNATKSPLGSCVGCHPPHADALPTKIAQQCNSCHATQPTHGKAQCLDCHDKHGGKPQVSCTQCHQPVQHTACTTCHGNQIHGPQAKPPTCQTCHTQETATAGRGHTDCSNCHQPHAPKPTKTCATCHEDKASLGHGTRLECTTCHRAHGPSGVQRPPACTTCHGPDTRKGLHSVAKHQDCASCHNSHEKKPRDDRATCIACHPKQKDHEPTSTRCSTCHPFR